MKTNLKFLNGWIDEFGKFYGCKFGEHTKIAPHYYVERKWIKISSYHNGHIYCHCIPTQAQINTMFDWCIENNDMRLWKIFEERHIK